MQSIEPIVAYFENKASTIASKFACNDKLNRNSASNSAFINFTMQQLDKELDTEINEILSCYNNAARLDVEELINGLYYSKEKTKYEFANKNSISM